MRMVAEGAFPSLLDAPEGPLGGSDCEAVSDGLLAQPVAAVTSLAYVVAGVWLAWSWLGAGTPHRRWSLLYAALLVLVGVGSVLYHGPGGSVAAVLHDLPVAALLFLAALTPVIRAGRRRPPVPVVTRKDLLALGVAVGAAVVAYLAGRTGSPICEPTSVLQPHGVWHAGSALALALWGRLLWPAAHNPDHRGGA